MKDMGKVKITNLDGDKSLTYRQQATLQRIKSQLEARQRETEKINKHASKELLKVMSRIESSKFYDVEDIDSFYASARTNRPALKRSTMFDTAMQAVTQQQMKANIKCGEEYSKIVRKRLIDRSQENREHFDARVMYLATMMPNGPEMNRHVQVLTRDELHELPNAYKIKSKVSNQSRLNILLDDRIHKVPTK